jgi:hypothetical protein
MWQHKNKVSMKRKAKFLLLPFALFALAGCGDNKEENEEIARGNDTCPPELPPGGHAMEFLPGGTCHAFWGNGSVSTGRYRADTEFLCYDREKGIYGHIRRYTFSGADTLRLDYVAGLLTFSPGTPAFYLYRRYTEHLNVLTANCNKP